jgi:HD superfamily phosphodiesterase
MEQKILNNALRYVLDLLEQINYYPYHNINHTLEVYGRCSYLCDKEFVYLQDKTDVLLAALFHDT